MTPSPEFAGRIASYRSRIETVLDECLALPDSGTARLREAMRYSALGGGKRLRPTLVYLTGESLGAPIEELDSPAACLEASSEKSRDAASASSSAIRDSVSGKEESVE